MTERFVNPIQRQLAQRRAWKQAQVDLHDTEVPTPPEPIEMRIPAFRRIRWHADRQGIAAHMARIAPRDPMPVAKVRDFMWERALAYRREVNPERKLVFATPAGVGKTVLGLRLAAHLAREISDTTAFLMPRHEHFLTLKQAVGVLGLDLRMLYHWLPVQGAEGVDGTETCKFPAARNEYQRRGYDGITFCAGMDDCGWGFIKDGCVWHGQAARAIAQGATVLCMQHQHLYLGHPMAGQCSLLIGDENPLSAAVDAWVIPPGRIVPDKLHLSEPMRRVCGVLATAARACTPMSGRTLVDACAVALDNHATLLSVLQQVPDPDDPASRVDWRVHRPEQVVLTDYNHVPWLAKLLRHEVAAALRGESAAPRVRVEVGLVDGHPVGQLVLLKRAGAITWRPAGAAIGEVAGFPPHAIFFDATAAPRFMPPSERERYYAWLAQARVEVVDVEAETATRVFQVHDRSNNLTAMFEHATDEAGEVLDVTTKRFDDVVRAVALVARSYLRAGKLVGVIGYKKLMETGAFDDCCSVNPLTGDLMRGHFGAERGTNKFEPCHVLLIVGVPQPPPDEIHRTALALIPPDERTAPFTQDGQMARTFEEHWFGYVDPATGRGAKIVRPLYADPDLRIIHWQTREGEVIQSVNRARGVLADPGDPKHVWLFLNLPIDELPPDDLIDLHDLFDAPENVDPASWGAVRDLALSRATEGAALTTNDLVDLCGVSRSAANDYLDAIERYCLDEAGVKAFRWPTDTERVILPRTLAGRQKGGRRMKFVLPTSTPEEHRW